MNTDHPIPPLSESELDKARAYIYLLETQAAERRTDKTSKGCIWASLIFAVAVMIGVPCALIAFTLWVAGVL